MDLRAAYKLMHEGAIALAEVEANGMRVDVPYLDKTIATTEARIKRLEERLRGEPEYALQRRRFGQQINLTSRDQLATVLFDDMGHKPQAVTGTGKIQLDETALERIDSKYARGFIRLEKLNKVCGTYLKGVRREVEGEFVHAFFGLHLVRTYRGQCDSPNLMNIPIRDPVQGELIRRAFIPRDGNVLVDMDYSSMEVRIACALSKDPKLTHDTIYGDMHGDMAAECYRLPRGEVAKATRQTTKGGLVFAKFYGDWYKQCAKNLWDGVDRYGLKTPDGQGLYDHLTLQGIYTLGDCDPNADAVPGTFEHHIKEVEHRFWNERFRVYHAKRKAWVEEYKAQGYIDLVTGFRCNGPMTKNQVMNYKIQGPAFHGLLWSLTRITREIKRRKMKTKIICQIHDSILADVPRGEKDEYLALAKQVTTQDLVAEWPWITVPLAVEAEVGENNWHEKVEVDLCSAS